MENSENVNSPYAQAAVPPSPKGGLYSGTVGNLVMGIIGVIFCWWSKLPLTGLIFFAPSFTLGLFAFLRSRKGLSEIKANPGLYARASVGLLKAARITGLIATIGALLSVTIGLIVYFTKG